MTITLYEPSNNLWLYTQLVVEITGDGSIVPNKVYPKAFEPSIYSLESQGGP